MLSTISGVHHLIRAGVILGTGLLISSCENGLSPQIVNTTVVPSTISLSQFQSDIQFIVTTQVLHMGDTITSVTAEVESEGITLDLAKTEDVAGGEEWSVTTTLTLWEGFSEGIYYIDITAVSSDGETVTEDKAAAVTITS